MAALADWVRTLAITLILAGVADMLVPDSGLKRQARLAIGLVVLAVLLAPLLRLTPEILARDLDRWWLPMQASVRNADTDGVVLPPSALSEGIWPDLGAAGTSPRSQSARQTRDVYLAMLDERLAVLAESVPGVRRARVAATLGPEAGGRWGAVARLEVRVWPATVAAGVSPGGNASEAGAGRGPDIVAGVRSRLSAETAIASHLIDVRIAGTSQ